MRASSKLVVGVLLLPIAAALVYWYTQYEPAKPRFYIDDELPSDVWQIPIIDPYRLITSDVSSGNEAGYSRWNFQYSGLPSFHPDSINYEKGLIIYHDAENGNYGFFDTVRETTGISKDFSQFQAFADSAGVSKKLYHVESVYSCWQHTRQLPWGKEIFNQKYLATPYY